MSLHICILGLDGSGKSSVTAALPSLLAAEFGVTAGSAGDSFRIAAPDEDHLVPKFHPDGVPLSAQLATRFKRMAKRFVDHRAFYPAFKLAQMMLQDGAARSLACRHGVDVMVSDGNLLLSSTGRAANYRRPASAGESTLRPTPDTEDLKAVFAYILEGAPLPDASRAKLPRLRSARFINWITRLARFDAVWLPESVVFLDLSPQLALQRIAARRQKIDRHENAADLEQTRQMYLKTLDAYERFRGPGTVHRIGVDGRSPGEVLSAVIAALRPLILERQTQSQRAAAPLGTTAAKLSGGALWTRVFNYRYLARYLLAKFFSGAWREPLFAFSPMGQLFLKEGYSAGVMRVIYDRDEKPPALMDRVFLGYPLHRAVYDRLGILARRIEPELERRLEKGPVSIFTAPSGFAYDLFRPLKAIAARKPELMRRVRLAAADLDPHDALADELAKEARALGIQFAFLKGDITRDEMREKFRAAGPFDVALFVGLSSWLPKPQTARHLQFLRENLSDGGLLVTDSFTPDAYALSGRYVGYKANYYEPENYRALLDYCGFDGLRSAVESGRDGINHVVIAKPRRAGTEARATDAHIAAA